jgi:hypothetical protein
MLPLDGNWPVGIALCALIAARLGDRERSAVIAELMGRLAGYMIVVGAPADCLGASELFAGLATYTAGQRVEGEALLAAGIERNRTVGVPAWEASARWEWAQLLLRDGDEAKARPLLVEALAGYDAIGAARLSGLVKAALDSLS